MAGLYVLAVVILIMSRSTVRRVIARQERDAMGG
jgi:hypothetical protein